jgi:hypothetical protein
MRETEVQRGSKSHALSTAPKWFFLSRLAPDLGKTASDVCFAPRAFARDGPVAARYEALTAGGCPWGTRASSHGCGPNLLGIRSGAVGSGTGREI